MPIERQSVRKTKTIQHSPKDLSILSEEIIAKAGVGIYIVQNGKFVYVRNLFQKITGYTDEELIGKNSLENIYSEDKEKVRKQAIKCLKKESFEPYEYRFIKKNNEVRDGFWKQSRPLFTMENGLRSEVLWISPSAN